MELWIWPLWHQTNLLQGGSCTWGGCRWEEEEDLLILLLPHRHSTVPILQRWVKVCWFYSEWKNLVHRFQRRVQVCWLWPRANKLCIHILQRRVAGLLALPREPRDFALENNLALLSQLPFFIKSIVHSKYLDSPSYTDSIITHDFVWTCHAGQNPYQNEWYNNQILWAIVVPSSGGLSVLSRFWRWHHLLVHSILVTCNTQVSQIWNCTMHIHFVCYEFIGLLLQIHKYTNTHWVIMRNTQIHIGLLL
jgi:hypothetical protein